MLTGAGDTSPARSGARATSKPGDGLSYTRTGMYGMFAIQESVRQVRGKAAAQVHRVDISVVLGNGGMFGACGG